LLGQIESDPHGRHPASRLAVIADMEAGLGTLTRMPEGSLDRALLVTDPSPKSVDVVRRARDIIAERKITDATLVIANRLQSEADLAQVRCALGEANLLPIPEDPEVRKADFYGLSPVDITPTPPAVQAVASLASSLAVFQG